MINTLKKRREFLQMRDESPDSPANVFKSTWNKGDFIIQMRRRAVDECAHGDNRVGFTATKRLGNAVQRNRAKRRLRALWQSSSLPHSQQQCDFVFIANARTLTSPFRHMQKKLQELEQINGK